MNYNKLSADFEMDKINFNIDYLEENNVSEIKEYITSAIEYKQDIGLFKLSNKRKLNN